MSERLSPRFEQAEKPGYLQAALILLSFTSTSLLGMALYQLDLGSGGNSGLLRLALIVFAGFVVSYSVLRLTIEKGVPLGTVGNNQAVVLSLGCIALVGFSFFFATLPGLIIGQVEQKRLQTYAARVVDYSNDRSTEAARHARLVPVTRSISADLKSKAACEKAESCVSLVAATGYGSTARTLDTLAARAASIASVAEAGLKERETATASLNALLSDMEGIVADEEMDVAKKRRSLRKLSGELEQVLTRLDEALPVAAIVAYGNELRAGITIPRKQAVSERINRFLAGYAASIDEVVTAKADRLSDDEDDVITRPAFPSRTAVPEALAHALDYLSVAMVTFVVDVLFPLALWAYTYWGIAYQRFANNPAGETRRKKQSDFDYLTLNRVTGLPEDQAKRDRAAEAKRAVPENGNDVASNAKSRSHTSSKRNKGGRS